MSRKIDFDVSEILVNLRKKNFGRNIFLFAMGMLISALAFNIFFNPYDVIPTGSTGLSLIISRFTKVDVSLVVFGISLIIFILALIFFGFDYALKLVAVTVLYPSFLKSTTLITRYIDLGDTSLFLIMIIGGFLMGFSSGLIRKSGFNSGGFSVIYDIIYKYFHISIGNSSLIINAIMIIVSGFIFGLNNAVYATISLLVSSYILDKVIIGISNNKVFYIVTDKPLEIRDYVIDKLNYSVTLLDVRGGYTNKKRKMLMCVVPTIEYLKLKELARVVDPKTFFLIVDTYDSGVKKNCKNM